MLLVVAGMALDQEAAEDESKRAMTAPTITISDDGIILLDDTQLTVGKCQPLATLPNFDCYGIQNGFHRITQASSDGFCND